MNDPSVYRLSLRRFYITQVLWNMMFFMPTWVIFMQERHGLSLTQVTLIDLSFWLTMALTEVPTGAVADTFGRKHSMLTGIGLAVFSVFLFSLAPNFTFLIIANSLWGIAVTFLSGADIAFFYDTLSAQGKIERYAQERGRLAVLTLTGAAVGNIIGGAVASWDLASPFWIYGLFLFLALLVGLGLKEPPRQEEQRSDKRMRYVEILRLAFQAIRAQSRLRLALLFANLLPLANLLVTAIFIQPHLRQIGIPLIWMGGISFAFSLVRIGASNKAGWAARIGGRWLWLTPWLLLSGLVGLALIPTLLGVAIFASAVIASDISRPLLEDLILRDTPEATRATILSVENLIFRVFLFTLEPGGGILADQFGLPTLFIVLGAGLFLATNALLFLWRPEKLTRSVEQGDNAKIQITLTE